MDSKGRNVIVCDNGTGVNIIQFAISENWGWAVRER